MKMSLPRAGVCRRSASRHVSSEANEQAISAAGKAAGVKISFVPGAAPPSSVTLALGRHGKFLAGMRGSALRENACGGAAWRVKLGEKARRSACIISSNIRNIIARASSSRVYKRLAVCDTRSIPGRNGGAAGFHCILRLFAHHRIPPFLLAIRLFYARSW